MVNSTSKPSSQEKVEFDSFGAGACLIDPDVPEPGVGGLGHGDGGHGEDDGELARAAVRRHAVDQVLVVVDAAERGHGAPARHQEELLRTLALATDNSAGEYYENRSVIIDL